MDRKDARIRDNDQKLRGADDLRCILCEGVIEIAEYDVYSATGRCRFCHEALEEEELSTKQK